MSVLGWRNRQAGADFSMETFFSENVEKWQDGSDYSMKAQMLSSDCQVVAAKEDDHVQSLQNLSPLF